MTPIDTAKLRWRVDHNYPWRVYEGDKFLADFRTPEEAQRIVDLLNSADEIDRLRKDAARYYEATTIAVRTLARNSSPEQKAWSLKKIRELRGDAAMEAERVKEPTPAVPEPKR